jgi:hypothetical protein
MIDFNTLVKNVKKLFIHEQPTLIPNEKEEKSIIDFEELEHVKQIIVGDQEPIPLDKIKKIRLSNGGLIVLPDDMYTKAVAIAVSAVANNDVRNIKFITD